VLSDRSSLKLQLTQRLLSNRYSNHSQMRKMRKMNVSDEFLSVHHKKGRHDGGPVLCHVRYAIISRRRLS
jgi:hypothetical protein